MRYATTQVRGVSPGNARYFDFLSAGILAQAALFVAIFYGISAIWERDLGVLRRYLVSPAPRSPLVMGKALSAGMRALAQAIIVYLLVLILGAGIDRAHRHCGENVRANGILIGRALIDQICLIPKEGKAMKYRM